MQNVRYSAVCQFADSYDLHNLRNSTQY